MQSDILIECMTKAEPAHSRMEKDGQRKMEIVPMDYSRPFAKVAAFATLLMSTPATARYFSAWTWD
jgi:hypothetical protein